MANKNNANSFNFKVNDEIKGYNTVRLIGKDIESQEVTLEKAFDIASELGMDLIEINSKCNPPIIRVCQYDKFIYELKKNQKKNKNTATTVKEIQLSVNIASNDLKVKAKKAKEFIEDGDKVKVTLTMKGRELNRREENKKSIFEFITLLDDVAIPESMPKDENNKTIVILKKKK